MTQPATPNDARRARGFAVVLACVSIVAPLLAAEALLRWNGYEPCRAATFFPNQPALVEPDPEIGWRNLPGHHVFPGYSADVERITMTIDAAGRRATGPRENGTGPRVALVGDSISEGWAISDQDTFAWKLQQRFPRVWFENYATAGYGGYQSLLVMRRLLAEDPRPKLILYGFVGDHGRRDVADPTWLRILAQRSRTGSVAVPYGTIGADGRLVEHAPVETPEWPLRARLATVFAVEQWWTGAGGAERAKQADSVNKAVIREMDRAARAAGADLRVVILTAHAGQVRRLRDFLRAEKIESIDCNRPFGPGRIVVGEGHPNEVVHAQWAECIGAALDPVIAEL